MEILNLHTPNSQGLTLVELLAGVAVIAIVFAIGIPGYRSLAGTSRVTTAINSMAGYLHYARSEAVTRGIPVVLCPSADGRNCDDTIDWQQGYMVFVDTLRNRIPSPLHPPLRYARPPQKGVSIRTSVGRKKLVYYPSGMSPGSTATITVCDQSGVAEPRAIIVSNAGRPRLSRVKPDGKPLICG